MNEADEIDEPLQQVYQHGMAIASQLGREISRMWQKHMEEKAKLSEGEARRLQMAFDSEKRTAFAALRPTQDPRWWDQAKPDEVIEAYRIANAWKDHDPAAAAAEKHIREQAQARFGIDGEALAHRVREATSAEPVLTDDQQRTRDLKEAKAYFAEASPERLNQYEEKVRFSDSAKDDIPYQNSLISEWRAATGKKDPRHAEQAREVEAQAVLDRAEGDQQTTAATAEYAEADREKKTAVSTEFDGPNAAEEAWYRDTFLADPPEAQETQSKSADAKESADQHEHAGEKVTVSAGIAYNSAERQEALAARMRDAGAPEKGIEARRFAESQQKHPISHAAAGEGKTVNKVKAGAPQKTQTQTKQRGR